MEPINIELQQNLKNKIKIKPSSFYKKVNVPSISGSSQTLGANPVINNFYIPSGVINFSLTELQFSIAIAEVNARYILIHADYFPYITRLELYSLKNKVVILDCLDVDKLNKICNPLYLDYKKRSVSNGFFHKSRRSTTNGVIRTDDPVLQALATVAPDTVNLDVTGTANVGTEKNLCSIWLSGALGDNGGAGNVAANYNLKLGDLIHDSIFNINKDIVTENLLMKITWNTRGNIYFTADANCANSAVAAADITITNLGLNIYSQNNPTLVNEITNKNSIGEEIIVPMIDLYTQPYAVNLTSHNDGIKPTNQFNNAYLYKIYSSIFITDVFAAAAATSQRQNNSSNHNAALWTQMRFYLNNDEIKTVNATNNEDFNDLLNNFNVEGTSLYDNSMTRNSGCVLTKFDSDKINTQDEYNNDELKGIPYNYLGHDVSILHKWTLPVINSTKTNYYFVVSLRSIFIKNGVFSNVPF